MWKICEFPVDKNIFIDNLIDFCLIVEKMLSFTQLIKSDYFLYFRSYGVFHKLTSIINITTEII